MKSIYNKQKYNRVGTGFTIVETLIATTIVLTAIVAPLTVVSKGLFLAQNAKDRIVASFLAQEAMEMVRNRRDQNSLQIPSAHWMTGLGSCISGTCGVDATNGDIGSCASLNGCVLTFQDSTGRFGHSTGGGWENTDYVREVTISQIDGKEVRVDVSVRWPTGFLNHQAIVRENLLNWQQ